MVRHKKTTRNDYTHLEQQEQHQGLFGRSEHEYGKENRYVKPYPLISPVCLATDNRTNETV